MAFKFIALKNLVGQRISFPPDQQPQDYLGILVPAFLGKPSLSKIILLVDFKVKGGDIVENDMDDSSEYVLGMFEADQLDYFLITVVKLVHVPVQVLNLEFNTVIGKQVITGLKFAGRETDSRIDEPPENIVPDYIEANVVENPVQKQFRACNGDIFDAFKARTRNPFFLTERNIQSACMVFDPFFSQGYKFFDFRFVSAVSDSFSNLVSALGFVDYLHTDLATLIGFFADKHT